MSYFHYDHADWVESNIAASKRMKPTKRQLRNAKEERKGWYAAPDQLNDFQRRAFWILGIVGNGIYNAPISWDTVVWSPKFIISSWHGTLATWDFQGLSKLVFLCHEARIRGDIAPNGPLYLQIALHERVATGDMATRHPNIDEAVAAFRDELGTNHPIMYCEASPTPETEAAE
jgi:hypothetical protein